MDRTNVKYDRYGVTISRHHASVLVMVGMLGGCGASGPSGFTPNPVANGGGDSGEVQTGLGGRGPSLFGSLGGKEAVAGASPNLEIPLLNNDIEAEAAGPGYRFTKWHEHLALAILAEGDGPPIVVIVHECDPPHFYAVPMPDDSFEVATIGLLWRDQPVVLVCNKERCLIEIGEIPSLELTRADLVPLAASETTPGDWEFIETYGSDAELQFCLLSSTVKRCFDGNGWLPDEPLPTAGTPDLVVEPICPDLGLSDTAGRWGVTAEGRVVEIQRDTLGEAYCVFRSEPLGAPLALFAPHCGISENLWLLTEQRLDGVWSCGCYID